MSRPTSWSRLDCLQLDGARDLEITWSHVWLSWYDSASRFMHLGVFLIQSASIIHLVCRCASLSTTFASSQSMTWFSSTAWSVMADLWVILLSLALKARVCVPAVKESTFFLCSLILRPNFLPVSSTYELEQFLQGTRAPSSCKQSRHDQDVRRTSKRCH